MSITDELRKAADDIASTAVPCGASPDYIGVRRKIDAIADRIDAEHDKALNSVDDAYDSGYNVGYEKGFASADNWLTQNEDVLREFADGWDFAEGAGKGESYMKTFAAKLRLAEEEDA